jgi:hypothetical protein
MHVMIHVLMIMGILLFIAMFISMVLGKKICADKLEHIIKVVILVILLNFVSRINDVCIV